MAALNKNNPFKTPESYFENFTDDLKGRLSLEWFNTPKEDGFTIPKDYFDGVHQNILKQLEKPETKVIQLASYKKYYLAAASVAAIVLLFLGWNWNTNEEPTWNSLAHSDIESYFETNAYDLSSYEIAEVLAIDELEINDVIENQFNEENLLDYLDEHIDDYETLNLEENE